MSSEPDNTTQNPTMDEKYHTLARFGKSIMKGVGLGLLYLAMKSNPAYAAEAGDAGLDWAVDDPADAARRAASGRARAPRAAAPGREAEPAVAPERDVAPDVAPRVGPRPHRRSRRRISAEERMAKWESGMVEDAQDYIKKQKKGDEGTAAADAFKTKYDTWRADKPKDDLIPWIREYMGTNGFRQDTVLPGRLRVYTGASEGGIQESSLWGVEIGKYDEATGKHTRLFGDFIDGQAYLGSPDTYLGSPDIDPSEFCRQVLGLRIVGTENAEGQRFRLDVGADLGEIISRFSSVEDPITIGDITLTQSTDETSEDLANNYGGGIYVPHGNTRVGVRIFKKINEQTSTLDTHINESGTVQSSDPNWPNPIPIDEDTDIHTVSTNKDDSTIYEFSFGYMPEGASMPVTLIFRYRDGNISNTLDQTVNGVAQPTVSPEDEAYSRFLGAVEGGHINDDDNAALLGMVGMANLDGEGINDPVAYLAGGWVSNDDNMGLGLGLGYMGDVTLDITFAARPRYSSALSMDEFVGLMKHCRDSGMPDDIDPMSDEMRQSFDRVVFPLMVKEGGIAFNVRSTWPQADERGGEEGDQRWTGEVAVNLRGLNISYAMDNNGVSEADRVTLGYSSDKFSIFLGYEDRKDEMPGAGDPVDSKRTTLGVRFDW